MPTVKPQGKNEPLTKYVEVEVLPACEMLVAIGKLTQPAIANDDLPQEWVRRVRRRLQPETLATIDQLSFIFPLSIVLKTPPSRTIEDFFTLLKIMPSKSFVDELFKEFTHVDDLIRGAIEKSRQGQVLSEAEYQALEEIIGNKALTDRAIKLAPQLNDQARIKNQLITAYQDFYDNYFQAEIERVMPLLEASANRTRKIIEAKILPVRQLIESLTNGITLAEDAHYTHVILAPSFYNAPYVSYSDLEDNALLMIYPARPEGMRIDGETVKNERLLQQLKTLADKTRFDILQLLAERSYSTQELAEALRLTQPTISYHMRDLRVAGLVRVEQHDNSKQYTLRPEFIDNLASDLKDALGL